MLYVSSLLYTALIQVYSKNNEQNRKMCSDILFGADRNTREFTNTDKRVSDEVVEIIED